MERRKSQNPDSYKSHSFLQPSLTRFIYHLQPEVTHFIEFMATSKVMSAVKTATSWSYKTGASLGSKGLVQLKTVYAEAPSSQVVAKNGVDYYKYLLKKNEAYIVDPATVENSNLIAKQLFYTRLASIPHRYEVFWEELDAFKRHIRYTIKNPQEWTLEKAGIVALFGVECYVWSCGGEIVGRGFSFIGYKV